MRYSQVNRSPAPKRHSENLVECKDCGELMAKSAWRCPHCGSARTKTRKIIVLLIVALIVFFTMSKFMQFYVKLQTESFESKSSL